MGLDTCVLEATALAISAKSRAAFSESLNQAGSLSCLRWSPENGCAHTFLMLLIFETNRRSRPISRKSASGGGEPGFQIDSITANMSDRSPLSLMLSTVGTELRLICGSPSRLQLPLLSAATAILCTKGDKLGPMGSSIEFKRLAASLSAVRSEFEVIVSICTHWYRLDVRWEHQVSDASELDQSHFTGGNTLHGTPGIRGLANGMDVAGQNLLVVGDPLTLSLSKGRSFVVRQAHHERT